MVGSLSSKFHILGFLLSTDIVADKRERIPPISYCLLVSQIFYLLSPPHLLCLEWKPTDSGSKHSYESELEASQPKERSGLGEEDKTLLLMTVQSPSHSLNLCL